MLLHASNAECLGSVPEQEIDIPHSMWCSQKIKNKLKKKIHSLTMYSVLQIKKKRKKRLSSFWLFKTMQINPIHYRDFLLVSKSCLTVWDPMDCSPPGSSVHGISQARTLEWVAVNLLQGIIQAQGLNLCLLHCRETLYHWATWKAIKKIKNPSK